LEEEIRTGFNDFANSREIVDLIEALLDDTDEQTIKPEQLPALRNQLAELEAVLVYPLVLEDRIEIVITTAEAPPLRRTVQNKGRS